MLLTCEGFLTLENYDLIHFCSTVVPSLAQFLTKCALETLDISDTDLGPAGCSNVLEGTLVSNRTLLHMDIRYTC